MQKVEPPAPKKSRSCEAPARSRKVVYKKILQQRDQYLRSILKSSLANIAACHCLRNSSGDCGKDVVVKMTKPGADSTVKGSIAAAAACADGERRLNLGERYRFIHSLMQVKKYDIAMEEAGALKDSLIQFKAKQYNEVQIDPYVLYVSKPQILSQLHIFDSVDKLVQHSSRSDNSSSSSNLDIMSKTSMNVPLDLMDEWIRRLNILIGRITVLKLNYSK